MIAAGAAANAHAAGMVNLGQVGARMAAGGGAAAVGGGMPNLGVSPQQALQASRPSIQNLGHAASVIAAQVAAQQAAAAAGTAANVPNGLAAGGLQVAPGVSFVKDSSGNLISQNTDTSNPVLWINANGPQQSVDSSGHVNVDIQQTGRNAVLTWQTMNVGKQTTLNFDQSGGAQTNGANNWVVLNRINDPSGAPSQILGNVKAQGSVYVINRNGILFGAGSQVNVHSLVASSLDFLNTNNHLIQTPTDIASSNQLFLQQSGGLAGLEAGQSNPQANTVRSPNEVLGLGNTVTDPSASQYQTPGAVMIAPGASISTAANGTASDGGFVLVAAPSVTNAGSITATGGQVILAAGIGVGLTPNPANPQVLLPELTGALRVPATNGNSVDVTPAGSLVNTGIVQAARGNVTLLGSSVAQNGVVAATTSVNQPGSITISTVDEYSANTPTGTAYSGPNVSLVVTGANGDPTNRAGQLTFGNGSLTTVLPDTGGSTATSSPGTTFAAGSIAMKAGSVWLQSGSLIEAPGSTVSITALTPKAAGDRQPAGDTSVAGRIYLDTGATIDVSGLANVELPISSTLVTVPRIGQNELADSPLLRNSFLFGLKNVVFDSTLSGTNADGLHWVGSPILNLAGYVSLIPRSVDQLLTNGGTINLAGAQVMTAAASSLNLNGGYIHYDGGIVNTTRLVDANGVIVPIGQANPLDTYVGVAGQFVERHPRWGVTNTWSNPLLTGGAYQADYIVGGNAGTLNIFASNAMVLDGDISAQAFGGSKQVQGNAQPIGGTFTLGAIGAQATDGASPTSVGGESGTIILQNSAPSLNTLTPGFTNDTPLNPTALAALSSTDPNNVLATMVVPVDTLNNGGFSKVSITEDISAGKGIVVASGAQLKVQPGGAITLNSPAPGVVNILGDLIAPSGTIAITANGNIVVGPDALISAAGQWVNNDTQAAYGTVQGGSQFINGGSISLSTLESSPSRNSSASNAGVSDTTGSIDLQQGSVLDVSSGGEMLSSGQMLMQNGIAKGTAGNVSLITYATPNGWFPYGDIGDGGYVLPGSQPGTGRILLDGTIRSEGFSGGGTLTLQAPGFQIGGNTASAPAWDLVLPASFFAQQGFGKYVLNALYDATVAPGTTVSLTQQNLIPGSVALQRAVTGTDLSTSGLVSPGVIDAYHHQATSLVMTGGDYLAWTGNAATGSVGQIPSYAGVTGGVTIGEGASIHADAGASVGLGSPAQVTVLGSIIAPGGTITLSGDSLSSSPFAQSGQLTNGNDTSPTKSVWLGANALLDVSGVALTNPLAAPVKIGLATAVPTTGKVLAGGTVNISNDSGAIVAQAGSTINVSGASAVFDEPQASGVYAPQSVWSDAGSITLVGSSALYFDGTLKAQPGAAQAQGGTLTLLAQQQSVSNASQPGGVAKFSEPGASLIALQQSGSLVPAGLAPGQKFDGTQTGVLQFSVDRLDGSGISTLALGSQNSAFATVPVAFVGNVDLNLGRAVSITSGQIVALSSAQLATLVASDLTKRPTLASLLASGTQTIGAPTVTIDAPYVVLNGPLKSSQTADLKAVTALADGTLNINASFIDLENQFQLNNFAQANFTSSGDIRLSSTSASIASGSPNALETGELYTAGNLTFKAADIYPSTGSTFIIDAVGPNDPSTGKPVPTTVTFLPNGTSGIPLSAGGSLVVDANQIVQSGTVRAPSGSLVFGVGDPANATTLAQFNGLPLVATDSVTLGNGSVTSVSNDGTVIPFGTTVDGVEWQFNPVASRSAAPDLTAPPAKFIGVNGSKVALNKGASIDLSGGGDLQAAEWVPGTGGSRDVLSQYNVSYASTVGGVALPVNANAGNVYAILPGPQSPVSAYDPMFAQSLQPPTNANGTVGTTTLSTGVGQAALNGAVGQSVYLSGVPGLAAGVYTLLPGKYATLPGAYRVTLARASGAVTPNAAQVLPDGTAIVAGYSVDSLSGARGATPLLFDVQSGKVWQQYSQYTLTGANTFFPTLAASAGAGTVTPLLPVDGGRLALAAISGLTLGATLNTAAGTGGAPAEVDIASKDIQITGNGAPALSGYLQIGASDLDSLNAGSLLIGGTRTQTSSGITITPISDSVVVSNNASSALQGPEVLLVTKTDPTGTDPNAVNGLRVDAGSVIAASGNYPAAKDVPITIGQLANSTTGAAAIPGDGALLRVSNGASVMVSRLDTSGTGVLTVGAGATLTGGQSLTLDSSGNLKVDPSVQLSGKAITAAGSAITFTNATGAAAANLPGFVIGAGGLAQLANAQQLTLRSLGAMNFIGDINATFGNSVDLSAGTFNSNGGSVTLNGTTVAFTNEAGAPVPTGVAGSGTLSVNAKEIDLGTGNKTVSGFGNVTMNATAGIAGQNTGTFDFGALPVTLNAPVYLAATGSASTLKTSGALTINNAAGTALTNTSMGGAWSFIGGTVNDNAKIIAPAGNVSLEATSGDLTIGSSATVSAAGVSKAFFDVTEYAPAGAIKLIADSGSVNVLSGSTLDFSGASGGGAAGSLTLSAPQQVVNLNGTLKGGAATGFAGGSFSLDTGGAVNLDNLAQTLASSGVNSAISVQAGAGNLTLSAGNTLTAHQVALTADGGAGGQDPSNGNVQILGSVNAAGVAGGQIGLYGKSGVDVEGSLIATGSSATQRGGTIVIDTSGTPGSTVTVNPTYGYENISAAHSGVIKLGSNAVIDVTGGTAGGLSGGTVSFRAPLLDNGGVNVTLAPGVQIKDARSVNLEAYAVWSTTDPGTGPRHFDGIVDPAGWYGDSVAGKGQPGMVAGTWKDQSGNVLAAPTSAQQLTTYLANDFFTPATANADHQTFYGYVNGDPTAAVPGTLMSFVENGLSGVAAQFATANVANFHVVPGIELDNPSTAINNGDISVLTNWNLGAGASPTNLAFRFNGQAPDVTFRAVHDVQVDASLTDGFFQIVNPTAPPLSTITIVPPVPNTYHDEYFRWNYNHYYKYGIGSKYGGPYSLSGGFNASLFNGLLQGPASQASLGAAPAGVDYNGAVKQYYGLYQEYLADTAGGFGGGPSNSAANTIVSNYSGHIGLPPVKGQPTLAVPAPTKAQELADPGAYQRYLNQYDAYATQLISWIGQVDAHGNHNNGNLPYQAVLLQPPPQILTALIIPSTVTVGTVPTDNTPSPVATSTNGLPLATASLNVGLSSSFRVVSGADLASANPLSVQAASIFKSASGGGDVTLDGHFAYIDTNNVALLAPTMIRTGTGSIDIAAGNNITLLDSTAPGVIYTAGAPAAGTLVGSTATIVKGNSSRALPDILVSPTANPDSAGDISIHAQGNITGIENAIDATGAVTGVAGANISQFWWQWMQITANPTTTSSGGTTTLIPLAGTSIDFGSFGQGVMSVGGNVSVNAGGNITDLAVSLPTTWYLSSSNAPVTVGGGNLAVAAGGNILSGDYFVAKGTGTITAGGAIASDGAVYTQFNANNVGTTRPVNVPVAPVSTLLATQDGTLDVTARQGADIGGIYNPSYVDNIVGSYNQHADFQSYSPNSVVNVASITGDVKLGTLGSAKTGQSLIGGGASGGAVDLSRVLPATVEMTAFSGGITIASGGELFPSATGNLNLFADQSINVSNQIGVTAGSPAAFGMLDIDPSLMPSPTNPIAPVPNLVSNSGANYAQTPLHAADNQPVHIYSVNGSIVDGVLEPAGAANAGFYDQNVNVVTGKPALIQAGQDIVNLTFLGQNLRASDFTRIVAGRDIYDTPLPASSNPVVPSLVLGGPGTFDIEAGRNIGPLSNQEQAFIATGRNDGFVPPVTGIDSVGNANNPNLPHESANVQVLFGIGAGIDNAAFISGYINPASSIPGVPGSAAALIAFMQQYDAGLTVDTGLVAGKKTVTLTADQAWSQFQALPAYVQQQFAEQVLFNVLRTVGQDYNNPASPYYQKYSRGYDALSTLFPASLGYTQNNLAGGGNGAATPVHTGNLDIRSTTIQTQQGGNVTILGPGGEALVGSVSAPPAIVNSQGQVLAGPGTQGILTLEQGDVNIFTDESILLAQSRIFTEQGGNMTIWSSNGDINAGKGSKSVADVPPPNYACDPNHYCTVDARGEVTGAGIATLQTVPGAPPGDATLVAPRGTVDAGDAGIRVSGNLNIAALHVANADNIQVQGTSIGVPVGQSVNAGALTAASSTASAANQMAQDLARNNASGGSGRRWVISVEVEGFGDSSNFGGLDDPDDSKKKRKLRGQ
ncbi:filamentous hemagglutinin family protein [Paraburkholderia agricolaris]|uniref:Filamentous hemagglutinin family protein n=2 Tax=Paraburkholderia agricolaris TaxID=2152888 RepID=A0ABW8ZZV9_9BURK